MRRQRVVSISIASIGHEADVLEIEFNSGAIYQYKGVSRTTFDEFRHAESKGTYFIENIRDVYPHERVK